MSLDGGGPESTSSEFKTNLSYTADESKPFVEGTTKSYPSLEESHGAGESRNDEPAQEYGVTPQKKGAMIHDFCFGIPYGTFPLYC